MPDPEVLDRYADLAVQVGANVAPGQTVVIRAQVESAPLVRAVARSAYRAGAGRVGTLYYDNYVQRALVEYGPEETLGWTSPWDIEVLNTLDRDEGAYIQIMGGSPPDLMADLDQYRVGRSEQMAFRGRWGELIDTARVNWTIVSMPHAAQATKMFGTPDVERLWELTLRAVRLDEADPVEAWRQHNDRLQQTAEWLNRLHLDSLHYEGPATDLRIGLLPDARFTSAQFETRWGRRHSPNLPTEEVFTSPDPTRAEGVVRSTRPLALRTGALVEGLELTFRDGEIQEVRAERGAEAVRAEIETDAGSRRLGEVALVDGSSRVGQLGVMFFETLFDENAACHLAYGRGFTFLAENRERVNRSQHHTDFMVGSPEVRVTGTTVSGEEVPIIRDNRFQLD